MIRIGLAQLDIIWESIDENKKKIEKFLKEAKEKGTDWIVFPEMTLTGFSMNTSMAAYYEETKQYFADMAKKYDTAIVYGVIAPGREGQFENRLVLVDENGKECMEYSKIHPFSYGAESKYYTGGDKVYATTWHDTVLSGFICYDLRFPAIFRIASEKAQVIFVIANWPEARVEHWDTLLKARAIEDCCYVVGVNRTGNEGRLHYTGHSAIYDYAGRRITEICEEEKLIVGEIDEQSVFTYRDSFPAVKDRKTELYKSLSLDMR